MKEIEAFGLELGMNDLFWEIAFASLNRSDQMSQMNGTTSGLPARECKSMEEGIIRTKIGLAVAISLLVIVIAPVLATGQGNGFDQYGYNDRARLFNGSIWGWAKAHFPSWTPDQVKIWLDSFWGAGPQPISFYEDQLLVMNWNAEWDRGNEEGWNDPNGYEAWCTNNYHGINVWGDQYVWFYKIIWVGASLETSPYWLEGGYDIWGQFEVITDYGMDSTIGEGLQWLCHATPSGLGNIIG